MARPHHLLGVAAGVACVCFLALVGTQVCGGEQGTNSRDREHIRIERHSLYREHILCVRVRRVCLYS
jgi:hypothetical protein